MELYVDVDALRRLALQLQDIKDSLEDAADSLSCGDLGSGRIDGALDDFVKGWKDGRKKIIEGIDAQLARIRGAINTYVENERAICKAARS